MVYIAWPRSVVNSHDTSFLYSPLVPLDLLRIFLPVADVGWDKCRCNAKRLQVRSHVGPPCLVENVQLMNVLVNVLLREVLRHEVCRVGRAQNVMQWEYAANLFLLNP